MTTKCSGHISRSYRPSQNSQQRSIQETFTEEMKVIAAERLSFDYFVSKQQRKWQSSWLIPKMHVQHEVLVMYIQRVEGQSPPDSSKPWTPGDKEVSILTKGGRRSPASKYLNSEGTFRYTKEEPEFVSQVYAIVSCSEKSGRTVHHWQEDGCLLRCSSDQ